MSEIEDLKRKLAARRGNPGYKASVAEIEMRIAEIEAEPVNYRDRETGKFVSEAFALANPDLAVKVRR